MESFSSCASVPNGLGVRKKGYTGVNGLKGCVSHVNQAHLSRKWVPNSRLRGKNSPCFDVVTYNILSDFFMDPDIGHNPNYPKEDLSRSKREGQLLMELENNKDTDVICLQEVDPDYFIDKIEPLMKSYGFCGCYMPETCGIIDGLSTFYKTANFDLVTQKSTTFNELLEKAIGRHPSVGSLCSAVTQHIQSQAVVMYTKLRCKRTGKVVTVANIHGWYGNYRKMDVTVMQISTAIRELVEYAGSDSQSYILCGDFNQEPKMPGYKVTQNGQLDPCEKEELRKYPKVSVNVNQDINLIDVVPKCFEHSAASIRSSYKEIMGKEPDITCCPDNADDQATLDYIWYDSNSMDCHEVLDVVSTDVLKSLKWCPNPVFPSDHLLMRAKFSFR
ncbi:uncharacterized protein [Ptychodera flava]|uniref:uncharacterized protein isoform X2 n=1 Tax=Ptychodera flava TaxID=63121 RepID=UPI003969F043